MQIETLDKVPLQFRYDCGVLPCKGLEKVSERERGKERRKKKGETK
jgi:hypothetical protein